MIRKIAPYITIAILIIGRMGLPLTVTGQERDRAKIADKYKWNLADIYLNEQAWRSAKEQLAKELPRMKTFQGKLGTSAATLANALDKYFGFDKELSRLYTYAQMLSDEDTRDAAHLGMKQEMTQLAAAEAAEAAFLEPEILRFEKGKVRPPDLSPVIAGVDEIRMNRKIACGREGRLVKRRHATTAIAHISGWRDRDQQPSRGRSERRPGLLCTRAPAGISA